MPTTGQIDPDDPRLAAVGAASITVGVLPAGAEPAPADGGTGVVDPTAERLVGDGLKVVWVAVVRVDELWVVSVRVVVWVPAALGSRADRVVAEELVELGAVTVGWVVVGTVGSVFVARTALGLKLGTPEPDPPPVLVPPKTHRSTLPGPGLDPVAPAAL